MTTVLPEKKESRIGVDVIVLGFLFAIFLSLLSFYLYRKYQFTKTNPSNPSAVVVTPLPPSPTPRAIPHGKKGFTVGQADKTVPQFGRGFIDPYDPSIGAKQTLTIRVKHSTPVTKVTAVLQTDHETSKPYELHLQSGTQTDGEWSGVWSVNSPYSYTYVLVLTATSELKSAQVTITLR